MSMYKESYFKFSGILAVCLVLGCIGMLFVNGDSLTGNAISTEFLDGASAIYLLVGIVAGVIIAGTTVYIYHVEHKRV